MPAKQKKLYPLTHPEYFQNKPTWIMNSALDQMLKKADSIVCVSQATADDLSFYAGKKIKKDRIHIVGEGVSPFFQKKATDEDLIGVSGLPPEGIPFLLVTGQISPRKNVEGVLKVLMKIKDIIPHHLVLVGGIGWDAEEVLRLIKDPLIAHRVHMIGYVSDEELRALYQKATAYIHPSLFEGFGLTVLEAMSAGCPVITSNRYSLPEVAGKAALLVDPEDVDEMTNAVLSICTDADKASELTSLGKVQVKKYSWANIAREMASLYKAIA